MALASKNAVFLHVPKTAGMWVRHAYKVSNVETYEIGDTHSHFPYLLKFKPESFYRNIYTFAFIRHPLSWIQSRWTFRMRHGWKAIHPLDYNCMSNNFHTFVENMLKYRPDGWVTGEYKNYIDTVPGGIKAVGRLENLVDDLMRISKSAGDVINANIIKTMNRINESDMDGLASKDWARYTPKLIDRVIGTEYEIISRYYSDIKVNYDDYI